MTVNAFDKEKYEELIRNYEKMLGAQQDMMSNLIKSQTEVTKQLQLSIGHLTMVLKEDINDEGENDHEI